jgi:cytidylate kinase
MMIFVVAIDGPAGTGKSSVARLLAQNFDFIYVDTGAIYRALAFLVEKYGIDGNDIDNIVPLIQKIQVYVDDKAFCTRIRVDGQAVDAELRAENISRLSSIVSQHKKVRAALLPVQRQLVVKMSKGAIFEGRDIGTVVFPLAPLKIFITANSETRAKRRFEEIKRDNPQVSYDEVLRAIKVRDERDENRSTAPTLQAKDAQVIDTSHMSLSEVTTKATDLIKSVYDLYRDGKQLW